VPKEGGDSEGIQRTMKDAEVRSFAREAQHQLQARVSDGITDPYN
jgi:hypothetical protein